MFRCRRTNQQLPLQLADVQEAPPADKRIPVETARVLQTSHIEYSIEQPPGKRGGIFKQRIVARSDIKRCASAVTTAATRTYVSNYAQLSLYDIGIILWLCGTAAALAWLGWCVRARVAIATNEYSIAARRLVRQLHELRRHLNVRPPLLLRSSQTQSPFLCGCKWRPAIILPATENFGCASATSDSVT
jgi:hypothetical protein